MARRKSQALLPDVPQPPPTYGELVEIVRLTELRLRRMGGRWHDSIPLEVRLELHDVANPLTRILIRAGRR